MKIINFFTKNKNQNKQKRKIIIHFHIFKNAGSTIEWVFEKNFKNKTLSIDGKEPGEIISLDKVINIIKKKPNVKMFSSHQIRFPMPKNIEIDFLSLLFIRHPIDRAFSIYYFKSNQTDDSIGSKYARSLSLKDFIAWNLKLNGYMVMKNFQVLFLSDKNTREKVDERDLDLAINRMKSCDIIGIVDRMDESLTVAEHFLQKYYENIDMSYISQNVSAERSGNITDKLKKEGKVIGTSILEQLSKVNKLDFELYQETSKELDRRIEKIENFEKKFENFKDRCSSKNKKQ